MSASILEGKGIAMNQSNDDDVTILDPIIVVGTRPDPHAGIGGGAEAARAAVIRNRKR